MDEVSVVVTGHRGFGAYPKSAVCPILISKYLSELPPIPVPVDAEGPVCHKFLSMTSSSSIHFGSRVCAWERGVWGVRARAQYIDMEAGEPDGTMHQYPHTHTHTHTLPLFLSLHIMNIPMR